MWSIPLFKKSRQYQEGIVIDEFGVESSSSRVSYFTRRLYDPVELFWIATVESKTYDSESYSNQTIIEEIIKMI